MEDINEQLNQETPPFDYDEMLRSQELAETQQRPNILLNVACFFTPLVLSPFTNHFRILGFLVFLCIPIGFIISLVPGPAKIRTAAACTWIGANIGWILCGGRFFGFQL